MYLLHLIISCISPLEGGKGPHGSIRQQRTDAAQLALATPAVRVFQTFWEIPLEVNINSAAEKITKQMFSDQNQHLTL